MAHAAACGLDMYVWPDVPKALKRALRGAEVDLVLLGHTHEPMKALIVNVDRESGLGHRDATSGQPDVRGRLAALDRGRRVLAG